MCNVTFVCCIESGILENQTLRMIYSLREWGGKYKDANIIAVTPRLGMPLAKATKKCLDAYSVIHIYKSVNKEAWFKYMNKPYAIKLAEKLAKTDYVCWVDSDILFLNEPFGSITPFNYELYACASDKNIGSSGPEDKFEPYWVHLCNEISIDINEMPWIITKSEGMKIRLYFNSGVFLFKKSTGFANNYLSICRKLLFSRISNAESGIYFTDQVALGLTVHKMGLLYKELPLSDNFPINRKIMRLNKVLEGSVAILHYHDAMQQESWDDLKMIVANKNIEASTWLDGIGPIFNRSIALYKLISYLLRKIRDFKVKVFLNRCKNVC
jgi:hypothetical protein